MKKIINPIEYKMPEAFGRYLLKNRKGLEAKMQPREFLCNYVNEQCGIKGTCVKVIFY